MLASAEVAGGEKRLHLELDFVRDEGDEVI